MTVNLGYLVAASCVGVIIFLALEVFHLRDLANDLHARVEALETELDVRKI